MITIEAAIVACFICLCFGILIGHSATASYWKNKARDIKDFYYVTNSFSELMKRLEEEYSDDC